MRQFVPGLPYLWSMSIRARGACLVVLATQALAACGGSDAGRARTTTATDRVADAQRTFEQRRDQLAGRLDDVLGRLRATVPEAGGSAAQLTVDGRADEQTIDDFLTDVLRNIDAYWSQTFRGAGLPEPSVRFVTDAARRADRHRLRHHGR
jgi:hypothetical protein